MLNRDPIRSLKKLVVVNFMDNTSFLMQMYTFVKEFGLQITELDVVVPAKTGHKF